MFDKILIANRGEIACRIIHTARRMGVSTVSVYSEADASALHVALADDAVLLGPAPASESYLRVERLVDAGFSEPDQWQIQVQAQIQKRARVAVKTGYLSEDELASAHFEAVDDVAAAAREALEAAGPAARLCVLPRGPQTIPYVL